MSDCLYFGCWGCPGNFLFAPGGRWPGGSDAHRLEYYGDHVHLDGTLAPCRHVRTGALMWRGMGATRHERMALHYSSEEFPQGEFLRHDLDTGYTAIQWWDRTQGDKRGACNSTILLRGKHTSAEMLEALAAHFPSVLARLTAAGVQLREVTP